MNGNIGVGKNLVIGHWNMGAKHWQRKKEELEAVLLEVDPDVFIISEANLLLNLESHEKDVPGFKMFFPLTVRNQAVARLVLLVKENLSVDIKEEYMDEEVATVWIKIGARGKKPVLLSGIYREHKFLYMPEETGSDRSQEKRWYKFVQSWVNAANAHDAVIIGDTNIDFLRWDTPEAGLKTRLVAKMKLEVETLVFFFK